VAKLTNPPGRPHPQRPKAAWSNSVAGYCALQAWRTELRLVGGPCPSERGSNSLYAAADPVRAGFPFSERATGMGLWPRPHRAWAAGDRQPMPVPFSRTQCRRNAGRCCVAPDECRCALRVALLPGPSKMRTERRRLAAGARESRAAATEAGQDSGENILDRAGGLSHDRLFGPTGFRSREPYDLRAAQCEGPPTPSFASVQNRFPSVRIVDLACGTGSTSCARRSARACPRQQELAAGPTTTSACWARRRADTKGVPRGGHRHRGFPDRSRSTILKAAP